MAYSAIAPQIGAQIAEAIARGATLLTPNQRAARSLRVAYNAAQAATGRAVWTPPAILPLEAWLATLWRGLVLAGHDTRMLLNRTQEHSLWRGPIAADPETGSSSNPEALADLAAGAFRLLHLYAGPARLRDLASTTDTRAFVRWSEAFARRCRREGLLAAPELPAALLEASASGALDLPAAGLALVDFDQVTPAATRLFESIAASGYEVESLSSARVAEASRLLIAADDPDELRQAALWARTHLARALPANAPEARLAIVVPNLADRRAALDRVFAATLAADAYEFSLGQPLAQTPAIAAALDLLRWSGEPLPLPAIGALLLSPFFGAAAGPLSAEALAAADFDAHVLRRRSLLQPELSLEAMVLLADEAKLPLTSSLRALYRAAAAEQIATPSARQTHAEWADSFRGLLEAAGWTAAGLKNSPGFQVQGRWESVLDEAATLDFAGGPVTAAEALAAVRRIAIETIFAPESRDAPVQILGPLDLGGVPFDALWCLSADDLTWPPASATHPLLPFGLQRSAAMPGGNPAVDAAHARALTARIAGSAAEVVFSYGARSEEGERRPSPMLAQLNLEPLPAIEPAAGEAASPFEIVVDRAPVAPLTGFVRGGAGVLQAQAACGFRAFAEHRLFSWEPATQEPGLDPGERGSLVHRVMESFWLELHDQQELRALPEAGRHALLDRSIAAALARDRTRARTPWEEAYLQVQADRLRALLRPWLGVELARPAFAVTASERSQRARVGPLELDLRVDRIDETEQGLLILDYKTGPAAPGDWLTDRPDAPQLPLYAILDKADTLAGVAFALLRAGEDLCLAGFADSGDVFGKPARMQLSLADQMGAWHEVLTRLAEDFSRGEAAVLPKAYPGTCSRCAQRMLCRLDPATLEDFSTEADEEPGLPGQAGSGEVRHG